MPRLPRGKIQVCVYLDEEVAEALRKHVIAKYGKVRYLSREVEEAVRAWIGASHEDSKTPPPEEARERDRALSTMGEEKEWSGLVLCPLCRRLGLLHVRIGRVGVVERPEVYVEHVREGKEVRCDLSLF
jgi:hypothetical protein